MCERKKHWEKVYAGSKPDEVSWYQDQPGKSLALIQQAAVPKDGELIDVGGGASRLVDRLLESGFKNLSVLDISANGLNYAKGRLGARAADVKWIEADVTAFSTDQTYDLWHDRAVFHFLTEERDRGNYIASVRKALKPGGSLILAAFAPDGPEKCSGLPVRRYDAGLVRETFGSGFEILHESMEAHKTPWDTEQKFTYFLLKRTPIS